MISSSGDSNSVTLSKVLVQIGALIVAVPVTIVVLWLGVMLSMFLLRVLMMGLPVVAIGGVIIFVCQMLEKREGW